MKKLVVLLFMISNCTLSGAQNYYQLGIGVSDVTGNYPETGARVSYSIGLGHTYAINEKWSVDPMAQVSYQGKNDYGIAYLKVPVVFSYKKRNWDYGGGLYLSYGLYASKNPEREYDASLPPYPIYYTSAFGYFSHWDAGLVTRTRYHFGKRFIGFEGSFGVLDLGHDYGYEKTSGHSLHATLVYGVYF